MQVHQKKDFEVYPSSRGYPGSGAAQTDLDWYINSKPIFANQNIGCLIVVISQKHYTHTLVMQYANAKFNFAHKLYNTPVQSLLSARKYLFLNLSIFT